MLSNLADPCPLAGKGKAAFRFKQRTEKLCPEKLITALFKPEFYF
jgi:hypothetical protein